MGGSGLAFEIEICSSGGFKARCLPAVFQISIISVITYLLQILLPKAINMQRLVTRRTFVAASAGLGVAAYATSSYYLRKPELLDDGAPKRTFTSILRFQKLTLESVEQVNHNVKRLRFALPQKDAVSGIFLGCTFPQPSLPFFPPVAKVPAKTLSPHQPPSSPSPGQRAPSPQFSAPIHLLPPPPPLATSTCW